VRWRLHRSERQRRHLEWLVAERTRDLATARDQAEAASRAKSAFLASMSHELRTPLNGVIGYAQLLQADHRLVSDQRERLRILHQSGEHLLRMINDVLDLAKIEAGKIELRPAPFPLAELLDDVAAAHAPAAAAKRLAFHRELAADLPAWVEGDAQKLRQILDNLLGNAVKFTASGSVTLRVTSVDGAGPAAPDEPAPGKVLEFSVCDTGPGIAASDRERLFQPFEQARATRPAAPGTGLGLAISRALVERMGGTLVLRSEPGAGSTFAFALALPVIAAPPGLAAAPIVTGYEGPRRRVLVVDDHAVNRSLLADLLSPLGFLCREAVSGEGALARLDAGEEPWPDLAIVDLRMDGMDGLELTRQLRRLPRGRELRVLLTSASVISFNPAEATAAGCDGFLPKPFRAADLIEKIGTLLALRWHGPAAPAVPNEATAPIPAAARATLRDALALGDLEAFRAALARVRGEHPSAAAHWDALDAAAAGFQLSRLRQLLDSP
jgi:signal transduction histidine kinase/DNA-binding response OmpR family regulator